MKGGLIKKDTIDTAKIQYRSQRLFIDKQRGEEPVETFILCNYLSKALSNIPYYRGYVSQSCNLRENQWNLYNPGSVIIWTQFSGTFKGTSISDNFEFAHQNTFSKIYSLILRSPFGQLLKNKSTFCIVTDMYRVNEQSVHNTGARLIKGIRTLGFDNCCLLFVGNKQKATYIANSKLNIDQRQYTNVTISSDELKSFISLESIF